MGTSKKDKIIEKQLRNDAGAVKWILVGVSAVFLFVMLILPLITVVVTALSKGFAFYVSAISDPYALKAVRLTLAATLWALAINTVFGLAAAWAVAKFRFRGKKVLTALIDLPVTVSPIIAGLIFIFIFGRQSAIFPFLKAHRAFAARESVRSGTPSRFRQCAVHFFHYIISHGVSPAGFIIPHFACFVRKACGNKNPAPLRKH